MKTFQNLSLTLCLLLSMTFTAFAGMPLHKFKGNFKNENSNTRGITKIQLMVAGSSIQARTFGSCSPSDCDWGKVKGTPMANSVSQKVTANTEAVQFIYKQGHATTYLIVTPINSNRIAVRSLTRFKDGSNRSDYTAINYFRRTTTTRPSTVLAAPRPMGRCGATYNHFPRKTKLQWRPVRGAVKYIVEVDCYHCCKSGKWCSETGKTWKKETVRGTSYSFNFVGAQPGRWRVRAVNRNGKAGKVSAWCNFKYTK
ncbi:MAG: hypothetical protein AAFV95_05025 [Bacteroidota bacterium]